MKPDRFVTAINCIDGRAQVRQVVADFIEGIGVKTGREGLFQTFMELDVEYQKSQSLCGPNLLDTAGEAAGVKLARAASGQDAIAHP